MQGSDNRLKQRVYVGLALSILVSAGWWVGSRGIGPIAEEAASASEPFLRVSGRGGSVGQDSILQERAEFFDPAPLFIPTPRNFGQGQLPARLVKQPGQVFGDFGAKLSFEDGRLAPYGTELLSSGEVLLDVVARSNEVPFAGMGESAPARPSSGERAAYFQIKSLDSNEIRAFPLESATAVAADFAPVEFVFVVGPAGLIGDPVLAAGSGRDEVDNFFQEYLAKAYRIGSVLSPGRYRVTIGP